MSCIHCAYTLEAHNDPEFKPLPGLEGPCSNYWDPDKQTLNELANIVCRDLPPGYVISIHLEFAAGGADCFGPKGERLEPDGESPAQAVADLLIQARRQGKATVAPSPGGCVR